MRKLIFTFCTIILSAGIASAQSISNCGTDMHTKAQRDANPAQFDAAKQAFEKSWLEYVKANPPQKVMGKTQPKYIIPVVFHIFHDNGSENISDAQVLSILAQLNQYYNADPALVGGVRTVFKDIVANCNFEFRLAKKDPNGNCTSGILRIPTTLTHKATSAIKELSTWDTKRYLNIWTAEAVFSGSGQQVGGFAQIPYGFNSSATDGLLVAAIQSLSGNTVPHEIGHSMGLLHPFEGSASDSCGDGDGVFDTPPTFFLYSQGLNNTGRGNHCADTMYNSCGTDNPDLPDNQENIMDYFEGPCSGKMFTLGQYERMVFCLTNYRNQLWQPENLVATGVNDGYTCTAAPIAAFSLTNSNNQRMCTGTSVNFRNNSYNATVNAYSWNFGDGATPATSTDANPVGVSWSTSGWKTITLTVTGPTGSDTKTATNYIYVEGPDVYRTIPTGVDFADWDYLNSYQQDGWTYSNESSTGNWAVTGKASVNGNNSLMLEANTLAAPFSYGLISPTYNLTGASSPYLSFNYAFVANYINTKNTNDSRDGLTLAISLDCGKTWVSKKTIGGPNVAEGTANPLTTVAPTQRSVNFVPASPSHWKVQGLTSAQIGASLGSIKFGIFFQYEGGNNFYIDNLTIGMKTGLENITARDVNFTVSPNPFSATADISYELMENSNVQIKLYDLLGKELSVLHNGKQEVGTHQLTINRNDLGLQSGLYIVKTTVGNSSFSTKVLIN